MTAPSSSVTFADLLRHHRMAAGLTQEALAERARLSVDAISRLECGTRRRPHKDTVELLAEALALPAAERAAFAAAARRSPAAALAATPPKGTSAPAALNGHAAASAVSAHTRDLPRGNITFHVADRWVSPARENSRMSLEQTVWSDDDEGCAVLYSYSHLPVGERYAMPQGVGESRGNEHDHSNRSGERVISALPAPSSAIKPGSPPVGPHASRWHTDSSLPLSGQGLVRSSRDAWPHGCRRALAVTFSGVVFALGLSLGALAPGDARWSSPSPHHLPSIQYTDSPAATQPALSGDASTSTTPNAHFAIVTLRVDCMPSTYTKTQYVPAGQRVYAPQGGASCTTINAVEVVGAREAYVYCRMDQPDAFTATFDGALFDCVGSRLGCHFVLRVETTDGR